jgi:hypothetical protein
MDSEIKRGRERERDGGGSYHTTSRNKIHIRTLEPVITLLAHCKCPFSDDREREAG